MRKLFLFSAIAILLAIFSTSLFAAEPLNQKRTVYADSEGIYFPNAAQVRIYQGGFVAGDVVFYGDRTDAATAEGRLYGIIKIYPGIETGTPLIFFDGETGYITGRYVKGETIIAGTTLTIPAGAITTTEIKDSDVASSDLKDGAVTTNKIGASAVTSAKITDGTINEADIADSAVTSDKISNGTIQSYDIADSAIGATQISDGSVGTAEIADSAVTAAKISDGAVGTPELADDAVTSVKILDGTISDYDIAEGGVSGKILSDTMATKIITFNITNLNSDVNTLLLPIFIADAPCTITAVKTFGSNNYSSETGTLRLSRKDDAQPITSDETSTVAQDWTSISVPGTATLQSVGLVLSTNQVVVARFSNLSAALCRSFLIQLYVKYEQ